jgi:hypothetical protein
MPSKGSSSYAAIEKYSAARVCCIFANARRRRRAAHALELSLRERFFQHMDSFSGTQRDALVAWAEANPRVQRVWVFAVDAPRNDGRDTDLDLAIELSPAVDGDEALSLWVANAEKWHDDLERRIGSSVDLEWFDPEIDEPLDASAKLAYERSAPDPRSH